MEYEERFGVKVDVRIPDTTRVKLYEQWERWKKGQIDGYDNLDKCNLFTRYEHFSFGSGVGLPPDPFKPLALQHEGANLEAIIQARRDALPPGKEYRHPLYPCMVKDFETITGLKKYEYSLGAIYPEISEEGRIRIPKIVAVYSHDGNKIDFDDNTIAKLQLPTSRNDLILSKSVIVREVFDFDNGYRIEYITQSVD